jgi:DNA-binding transcriptional LysR family regulator
MQDWENLRHLAALARGGSLSAAARELGVEHATVARRVGALEAETNIRIVDRRGRKLLLTPEGERLAAVARRMEREALAVERVAMAAREGVSGTVTVSAPPAFAAARLAGPMVRLQAEHPGLRIQILGEVREASLDHREADIAVRLNRPREADLRIVRLGEINFHFYASPAYLTATAAENWCFIAYGDGTMVDAPQSRRLREFAAGRPVSFLANTAELHLAAARAGGGVAILPDFLVADDPALMMVDDGAGPLRREIWLAVHADLRTAPAVRAVVDALKAAI